MANLMFVLTTQEAVVCHQRLGGLGFFAAITAASAATGYAADIISNKIKYGGKLAGTVKLCKIT